MRNAVINCIRRRSWRLLCYYPWLQSFLPTPTQREPCELNNLLTNTVLVGSAVNKSKLGTNFLNLPSIPKMCNTLSITVSHQAPLGLCFWLMEPTKFIDVVAVTWWCIRKRSRDGERGVKWWRRLLLWLVVCIHLKKSETGKTLGWFTLKPKN